LDYDGFNERERESARARERGGAMERKRENGRERKESPIILGAT
jgi:hypothetical protein